MHFKVLAHAILIDFYQEQSILFYFISPSEKQAMFVGVMKKELFYEKNFSLLVVFHMFIREKWHKHSLP